jgi:hypothetical protein
VIRRRVILMTVLFVMTLDRFGGVARADPSASNETSPRDDDEHRALAGLGTMDPCDLWVLDFYDASLVAAVANSLVQFLFINNCNGLP